MRKLTLRARVESDRFRASAPDFSGIFAVFRRIRRPRRTARLAARSARVQTMNDLAPYIPIGMIVALAIGFGAVNLILGRLIGPRKDNPSKSLAYESGMTPVGEANVRIPVKFYMVAVLFVLFDIETVFILAWAVVYRGIDLEAVIPAVEFSALQFTRFAFVEMLVFILILLVGYIYVWRKGGLRWS
jgi:NADH-quinone oxidoreductase subunit A